MSYPTLARSAGIIIIRRMNPIFRENFTQIDKLFPIQTKSVYCRPTNCCQPNDGRPIRTPGEVIFPDIRSGTIESVFFFGNQIPTNGGRVFVAVATGTSQTEVGIFRRPAFGLRNDVLDDKRTCGKRAQTEAVFATTSGASDDQTLQIRAGSFRRHQVV